SPPMRTSTARWTAMCAAARPMSGSAPRSMRPRVSSPEGGRGMYTTMHDRRPAVPSRRQFLKTTAAAAGALVVATYIDFGRKAQAATMQDGPMPNAFVRIAPDNSVTVIIKHLDMGQGNTTGLATIVADELDADWAQVRTEFAPANAALYNNLFFGPVQGT